jgi:hypothetical protein
MVTTPFPQKWNCNYNLMRGSKMAFTNEDTITPLMDTPNVKAGSFRYRNMEIILQCKTVGEALKKLRAQDMGHGGMWDIRFAVEKQAIAVGISSEPPVTAEESKDPNKYVPKEKVGASDDIPF